MKVKISSEEFIEADGEKHYAVTINFFYEGTNKKSYERMSDFEKTFLMAEYISEMSFEIENCFKEIEVSDDYMKEKRDMLIHYIQNYLFRFRHGEIMREITLFF